MLQGGKGHNAGAFIFFGGDSLRSSGVQKFRSSDDSAACIKEYRSYFPSVSRKSLLIFNVKVWSDNSAACIEFFLNAEAQRRRGSS